MVDVDVCFVDEAVYTVGRTTALQRHGWHKGQSIKVIKERTGYSAIAVVDGINVAGEVITMEVGNISIKLYEF